MLCASMASCALSPTCLWQLGEWRIAEEDGAPFIEFTHILPELMQQLLEIDEDKYMRI
jgi:hypothetical protein